jgi:hypothetical protein
VAGGAQRISARRRNPEVDIWKLATDSIVYPRSAPPVNVVTGLDPFGGFLSGADSVQRPNLVPGVPLWVSNPNVAGGREISPAAFTIPAGPAQGDLGRNALRAFGATEVDLTLRREFKPRAALQRRSSAARLRGLKPG